MMSVTKESLAVRIDQLYRIKDEQGQLSMSGEYNLEAYKMLLDFIVESETETHSLRELELD